MVPKVTHGTERVNGRGNMTIMKGPTLLRQLCECPALIALLQRLAAGGVWTVILICALTAINSRGAKWMAPVLTRI